MFVATIKRCGGSFYKVARNPAMGAVPVFTRPENLQTYFGKWPKRFSSYLAGFTPSTEQSNAQAIRKPFNLVQLNKKYRHDVPLVMLTAYDSTIAALADQAGVDILLVGDSFGNVKLGHHSTVSVSMEEMLIACQAVRRGSQYALIVGDLPFGSYLTEEDALKNSSLMLKAGCDAVKLEGGKRSAAIIARLVGCGISVMGHIGLTPQTHACWGFRTQGKSVATAEVLLADAKAVQEAGAFSIVVEKVPEDLGELITQLVPVPIIGIGAGGKVSGQVLVSDDVLGLSPRVDSKPLSFVKQYLKIAGPVKQAFANYTKEVRNKQFPLSKHSDKMAPEVIEILRTKYPDRARTACCVDGEGSDVEKNNNNIAIQKVEVFHTIADYKNWRNSLVGTVGFVPTMGKLHAGHLALAEAAAEKTDHVVVSIFVNPSQFAKHEDLDKYPRDLDGDILALASSPAMKHTKIVVFAPTANEMYPSGARGLTLTTSVQADGVKGLSEDSMRPHFFQGVATVCTMLFNIVQPQEVFFGQKDAMQCAVIRGLVRDMHMPIKVNVHPTVRENDGLAMSSRNTYLTPAQRTQAGTIIQALLKGTGKSTPNRDETNADVKYSAGQVRKSVYDQLVTNGFNVDYVSLADPYMKELTDDTVPLPGSVLSIAARTTPCPATGSVVRLLDNIVY